MTYDFSKLVLIWEQDSKPAEHLFKMVPIPFLDLDLDPFVAR